MMMFRDKYDRDAEIARVEARRDAEIKAIEAHGIEQLKKTGNKYGEVDGEIKLEYGPDVSIKLKGFAVLVLKRDEVYLFNPGTSYTSGNRVAFTVSSFLRHEPIIREHQRFLDRLGSCQEHYRELIKKLEQAPLMQGGSDG